MTFGSSDVRHIAIVTTDDSVLPSVEAFLAPTFNITLLNNPDDIMPLLTQEPLDAILLDVDTVASSTGQGLGVLQELRGISEDFVLIALTRSHSHSLRRRATESGADDLFVAPVDFDELRLVLERALERRGIEIQNRRLRDQIMQKYSFCELIGGSEPMRRVYDAITRVADSPTTVVIRGESGTGKELVARAIHSNSPRCDRAFVTVNSGNLPPDLLESTLFGHVKGAFTGAIYPKKGLCDLADRGSIFFDEIGNIPADTQAKLLRVMQEREFMRLGGMETIKVDVRIIAATNCDLLQMVDEGRFREDLYYRLHVINIFLPPLRDRKDDIPYLAQHFLEKYSTENNKREMELSADALDLMMEYDWPGNVRELENVMERAVVLSSGSRIGPDLIPDHVRSAPAFHIPKFVVPPEGISFKDVITNVEKRLIESTLEAAGGVQKRAAELLKIKPTTLNEMIKRYDIGTRRKKASTEESSTASRTRPFPAAELTRD